MGVSEMVLVYWLMLGGGRADALSILDADHYFESRKIDVKGDGLLRIAGRPAKEPGSDIARLLAIRTLGERKDKSARATLEAIARTEKGFAKGYAELALARIDGKEPPVAPPAKDSVRKDALAWFPADAAIFGAVAPGSVGGMSAKEVREAIGKMMPPNAREEVYAVIEKVGNIRIDRYSGAWSPEPKELRGRFMFRITGQGDRKRIAAFLKEVGQGRIAVIDDGEITRVNGEDPPAFALIGDTELIIGGYNRRQGIHREVVDDLLAVKAGKKAGVLKGVFSKDIAGISETAMLAVVGSLTEEMRKGMIREIGTAPHNFVIEAAAAEKALKLRGRAEFESAEEAKRALDVAEALVKQGLAGLDELKQVPEIKPETIKAMRTALESVKFKSEGALLLAEVAVPADLPRVLMDMLMMTRSGAAAPRAPQPALEKRAP